MSCRLALVAALAAVAFAVSANPAGAGNVYLPNYGTSPEATTGFAFAADGSLSPLAGSPFPLPAGPTTGYIGMGFTPEGGRGVAIFLFDGGVRGLAVAPDGAVTAAGPADVTPSVQGLAVSPDGRFAYAATRDFQMVAAVGILGYSIGANGGVTQLPTSPFSSGQVGDLAITPDGRFLYAIAGGQIKHFFIAPDGRLTATGVPIPSGSAQTLAVSPDGRYLFAGRGGGSPGGVTSYSIAPSGNLTQNGSPALTGADAMGYFAVSPNGRFVYMPDLNLDGIVTAAVGADGSLSVVGTTPVANPEAVAVSPDSRTLLYSRSGLPGLVGTGTIGANGEPALRPGTVDWSSGEPQRILFAPSPAPVASFGATGRQPGDASRFDAGASARAARYDWDFGDGATLANGGPAPSHTYAAAGVYEVRLTVTDAQGCSTQSVYTGQSTTCPGGSSATATTTVDTPPALTRLTARKRRGTVFRYRLSEAARVRFTIRRRTSGRRVGGRCRRVTPRNRGRRRCALLRRVGSIGARGKAGRNRKRFSGRLRGRRLKPGAYRATAVARDSAGGRSAPRSVRFRMAPRRR